MLEATPVRPLRVRESRWSWRLDACCNPLGECRADPELWSLLRSCHVLRESKRFAPVVAWMRTAPPSGSAEWLRVLESCSSAATLRATISRSQPTYEPVFFGRPVTTLRMTPACVPGLPRGVRCKRCAQRQPRRTSLGRRSAKAVFTPACRSRLLREARHESCAETAHPPGRRARPRSCLSDGNQQRRKQRSTLRGARLRYSYGGGRRVRARVPTKSALQTRSCHPQGRQNPLCAGC